jgi:hypothetical protein
MNLKVGLNNFLDIFSNNISPEILLNESNIQIFYQRYIFILATISFLIFSFSFLLFSKDKILHRVQYWRNGFWIFGISMLSELFYITMPFLSLKIIFYFISNLFFVLGTGCFLLFLYQKETGICVKRKKLFFILVSIIGIVISLLHFTLIFNYSITEYNQKFILFFIKYFFIGILITGSIITFSSLLTNFSWEYLKKKSFFLFVYSFNLIISSIIVWQNLFFYNSFYIMIVSLSFILGIAFQKDYFIKEYENNFRQFINLVGKNIIICFFISLISRYMFHNSFSVILIFILMAIEIFYFGIKFSQFTVEYNSISILSKLRIIDSLDIFQEVFQEEVIKIFHLSSCTLIPIEKNNIELKNKVFKLNYYTEKILFNEKTYDLGIKLNYLNNPIGMVLINDSRILFYKKKSNELKLFLEKISPFLDQLLFKELKSNSLCGDNDILKRKLEEKKEEIFYIKEFLKMMKKKEDINEIKNLINRSFSTIIDKEDEYE